MAFSLVALLLSASPTPGEDKPTRAARLMTEGELAQLASIDAQLAQLQRPVGNSAMLISSIVALSAGLAIPVVGVVFGLVGSLFIGFFGLIGLAGGSTAVLSAVPGFWALLFGWVPVWGWVAMGVAAAIGAGLLVGALVSDAPRAKQVRALQGDRRRLLRAALARPETAMLEVPLVTLAAF